jgi:large subunit ribosomal protein L31
MKKGLHPEYVVTTVSCNCGNVIHTRSTMRNIHVETCSKCHGFYTGKNQMSATAGRVDKFNTKYASAPAAAAKKKK